MHLIKQLYNTIFCTYTFLCGYILQILFHVLYLLDNKSGFFVCFLFCFYFLGFMKAGIKLKTIKNLFKVLLISPMMPEVCK